MTNLLQDPMFFYTVAFTIFLVLVWRYGRAPILNWLDGEIIKIRDELEQASRLRIESEAVYSEYQKKHDEAIEQAKILILNAQEEAKQIQTQAKTELKTSITRLEQQMTNRIRFIEAEAIAAVQSTAVSLACNLARQNIAASRDDGSAKRIVDQAIQEIPTLVAAKAKAA